MWVAEGKGCYSVAAQYANKGELVLRCNAYVQKLYMAHCKQGKFELIVLLQ